MSRESASRFAHDADSSTCTLAVGTVLLLPASSSRCCDAHSPASRAKIGATTTPYRYVYDELDRLAEVRNNTTKPCSSARATVRSITAAREATEVTTGYAVADAANQLTELHSGSEAARSPTPSSTT